MFNCSDRTVFTNDVVVSLHVSFLVHNFTLFTAETCNLLLLTESLFLSTFVVSVSPSTPASFKLASFFPASITQYTQISGILLQLTDAFGNNVSVTDYVSYVTVAVKRRSVLKIPSGAISGSLSAFLIGGVTEFTGISFNLAPAEL